MRSTPYALVIAVFFFLQSPLSRAADDGQGDLSLEEAIETALAHSPKLDEQREKADLSDWKHAEALSGFLPTLSVGGHYFFDTQVPTFMADLGTFDVNSVPSLSPSLDAEVYFKLPLFDGLRNFDRYNSTKQLSQAASLDVDYGAFTLGEQVKLAYFGVIESELLSKAANEDVKDLQDHRQLVEEQLRVGIVKKVDLLRVDTQLSNAISERTNADDDIEIKRQQLAELLGSESEDRGIVETLPVPQNEIAQALAKRSPESRPDIEALQIRWDAESASHRSDSKWWVPSLAFSGVLAAYRSDELKVTTYALGLSLSWNIFDGLASYSRSKESLAEERIALRTEEASRLQAKTDIETYQRRYHYYLQKYGARVDDVARSLESVRLAKMGFRAGSQTSTDVLDAEQDLFNARANQIQSQYGALESLIRYEIALGRNITP